MIFKNPDFLSEFCIATELCLSCGKRPWGNTRFDPHHCFISRGASGSDFACNIAPLHRLCHSACENNAKLNRELREKIARREGASSEDIMRFLMWFRILPKKSSKDFIVSIIDDLPLSAQKVGMKALEEMP